MVCSFKGLPVNGDPLVLPLDSGKSSSCLRDLTVALWSPTPSRPDLGSLGPRIPYLKGRNPTSRAEWSSLLWLFPCKGGPCLSYPKTLTWGSQEMDVCGVWMEVESLHFCEKDPLAGGPS